MDRKTRIIFGSGEICYPTNGLGIIISRQLHLFMKFSVDLIFSLRICTWIKLSANRGIGLNSTLHK